MLNESIRYRDEKLFCDDVSIADIVAETGTPVYIYSQRRILSNLRHIQTAFAALNPHIHYSAKANANLAILRTLVQAGVGIDAVSAGEIHRALLAGAKAEEIVFAGVGKTADELTYAIEHGIGWINAENVSELQLINVIASKLDCPPVRVALRFNPNVTADTHPNIATGHGGAKFGLSAEVIREILVKQAEYPHIQIEGIHIHIGSQLHNTSATQQAVEATLELIAPYPTIRTINIGGGLPVAYHPEEHIPDWEAFATALAPLLKGHKVMLEPGRSIIADAGILVASTLYVKEQAGQTFLIIDASMAELIRPALYEAHHEIVTVKEPSANTYGEMATQHYHVVGPVCETTDVLGRSVRLPRMQPSDLVAVLTAGAYGMVMASNYNQRPRPPEVMVLEDGKSWQIVRRRETWDDLTRYEL